MEEKNMQWHISKEELDKVMPDIIVEINNLLVPRAEHMNTLFGDGSAAYTGEYLETLSDLIRRVSAVFIWSKDEEHKKQLDLLVQELGAVFLTEAKEKAKED